MTVGLLDTSVIIDWDDPAVQALLPVETAVSTVTMAELAAGPHLTSDPIEAARRQARLQRVEAMFEPLAFDAEAARYYGQMVAATVASGRHHRSRMADLMVAAIARGSDLTLFTRNAADFEPLAELVTVVVV